MDQDLGLGVAACPVGLQARRAPSGGAKKQIRNASPQRLVIFSRRRRQRRPVVHGVADATEAHDLGSFDDDGGIGQQRKAWAHESKAMSFVVWKFANPNPLPDPVALDPEFTFSPRAARGTWQPLCNASPGPSAAQPTAGWSGVSLSASGAR